MSFSSNMLLANAHRRQNYPDFTENDVSYSTNRKSMLNSFRMMAKQVIKHPERYPQTDYGHERVSIIEIRDSKDLDNLLKPKYLVDIEYLTCCINKTLNGKFFLGRVLVMPFYGTEAIRFVAEDAIGKSAIRVTLYNNPLPLSSLKKETFFIILNPLFVSNGHDCIELRSDDPNEVLILTWEQISSRLPNIYWENYKDRAIKPTVVNPLVEKLPECHVTFEGIINRLAQL